MCVDMGGGCGDGGGFRAMRAWLTRSRENIILRFLCFVGFVLRFILVLTGVFAYSLIGVVIGRVLLPLVHSYF